MGKRDMNRTAIFTHRLFAPGPSGKEVAVGFRAKTNTGTSIEVLFEAVHLDKCTFRAEPLTDGWWRGLRGL